MNDLENFLNERKKEIEQFFQFLECLEMDLNRYHLITVLGNEMKEEKFFTLNHTHSQIFKSNCILLLYNCIEGTVYKSLSFVIDKINDDGTLTHKDVINEIQEIWLKYNLLKNGNIYNIDSILVDHIEKYINEIININFDHFRKEIKGYFGNSNITDEVIYNEVLPKIGINMPKVTERKLDMLKEFRNQLAHGNNSFVDIGLKITYKDIVDSKNKTFKYLEKYVKIISEYVSNKEFKVKLIT